EQDRAAARRQVAHELLGLAQQTLGLQQVDDVDPTALAPDEPAHLRVPTSRLVAEVDAGLRQLTDADFSRGHVLIPFVDVMCIRRPERGTQGIGAWAGP